jgi:DUF4097 and DUF4098 domain-containing protein YvlB
MKSKFNQILALVAVAFVMSATAAAEVTGSFNKTLPVSGVPDVELYTGSGNIRVRAGDASSVTVYARIKARDNWLRDDLSAAEKVKRIEANPPIKQTGNMITIGRIEDRELRRNVSIDYELTVPSHTKLLTETGSGDQEITNVSGPLRAQTGSGNVVASGIGGDARLSTGSGDVKLDDVSGRLYAKTGSGNIVARNVKSGMDAETGSGDIEYDQTQGGDVAARTGSGNIRLRSVKGGLDASTGSGDVTVDGEVLGAWEVETGSGNINLRVPTQSNFDVKAWSSSGSVTIDHPVTMQGTMRRNRVEGKVGSGGALLSLHTGSGDINIR